MKMESAVSAREKPDLTQSFQLQSTVRSLVDQDATQTYDFF